MHSRLRKCIYSAVNWTAIAAVALLSLPMGLLSITIQGVEKAADAASGWLENERIH